MTYYYKTPNHMYIHKHIYICPDKHLGGYGPVFNTIRWDNFNFYIFLCFYFLIFLLTIYYLYNDKFLNPLKKVKLTGQLRHLTNYIFNRKCTTAKTKNYLK